MSRFPKSLKIAAGIALAGLVLTGALYLMSYAFVIGSVVYWVVS